MIEFSFLVILVGFALLIVGALKIFVDWYL